MQSGARSCDSKKDPDLSLPRGLLKTLLLVCAIVVFGFQARTSQLATILLSASSLGNGRLPSDWTIKVNTGKPDVSVCTDGDVRCVHLKSVKS